MSSFQKIFGPFSYALASLPVYWKEEKKSLLEGGKTKGGSRG